MCTLFEHLEALQKVFAGIDFFLFHLCLEVDSGGLHSAGRPGRRQLLDNGLTRVSQIAEGLAICNPTFKSLHELQREQRSITTRVDLLEVSTPDVEKKASFADARVRAVEDLILLYHVFC